ncbi:DUF6838 family protein [Paenibacillus sp. FJAT-26967]|uniref:phage tail terminator family protein n=1 Tax=Paenibacillus sp. FJAT-26967 TaxID=1729690 RepID=UPI0008396953|nr:hypothetical protein [Paenibacillus sp. FJAT-26967]
MTENKIRDAVAASVAAAFPSNQVYDEKVPEALQPGSFYIQLIASKQTRLQGRRYSRACTLEIRYFGATGRERHHAAEQLYDKLEFITAAGSMLHGIRMRHEAVDDVLRFYVDYEFQVLRTEVSAAKMGSLKQEGQIKHD